MKIYNIVKKEDASNVFGISLVAQPAMESDYVRLSKENTLSLSINEKIQLSKDSDIKLSEITKGDKRMLMGLVLEPDKLIYRYNEKTNEEYYVTVSKETILELAKDYAKKGNHNNSTLEHDGKGLEGVSFFEHWIVEDSKVDKSALHGFSFKKGSWVTVADIENEQLYNEKIASGEVMGFSIDAVVRLEEVKLNKQVNMSKQEETGKSIAEKLLSFFKSEVKLSDEVKEEVISEEVKTETEEKEAVEVKTEEVEEVKEPEAIELSSVKGIKEFTEGIALSVKESLKPLLDKNIELTKQVEELSGKVVELGKQPAAKSISSAPAQLDYSKMSNIEKMNHNKQ